MKTVADRHRIAVYLTVTRTADKILRGVNIDDTERL